MTVVTPAGAEIFGQTLAITYTAGVPVFGAAPSGWDGRMQIGRLDVRLQPHVVEGSEPRRWGEFYTRNRILPHPQFSQDNGSTSVGGAHTVERLCEYLRNGDSDTDQSAPVRAGVRKRGTRVAMARTRRDLWCDNVLWIPVGETAQWVP